MKTNNQTKPGRHKRRSKTPKRLAYLLSGALFVSAGGATAYFTAPQEYKQTPEQIVSPDPSSPQQETQIVSPDTPERQEVASLNAEPSSVTVTGKGYGHGRGMSQWGSQGAALLGKTYKQILTFYYPGAALGKYNTTLRVLLSTNTANSVIVKSEEGLRFVENSGAVALPTEKATRWRLRYSEDHVTELAYLPKGQSTWKVYKKSTPESFFKRGSEPVTLYSTAGVIAYRGKLGALDLEGTKTATVNYVAMQQYLRGVVPAESPAYWEAEALKAQSVAARTYAAWHTQRSRSLNRAWDICDTTACQVYPGVSKEYPSTDAAVAATFGVVLELDGNPIFSEFSASNGGYTVASSVAYQTAKQDPWDGTKANPHNNWKQEVTYSKLSEIWPKIGKATKVQVVSRDGNGAFGGRVLKIKVSGSNGAVEVTGEEFRSKLGLRSTLFSVATA